MPNAGSILKNGKLLAFLLEGENTAVLEITGTPQNDLRSHFGAGDWFWGGLKRTNSWYVGTPMILLLDDGIVRQVVSEIF